MCPIYLRQGDGLVEMVEKPFEAEAILQKLLADYPSLLAGDQDATRRKRWLLVQREVGIPGAEDAPDRFSLDHLFLDEEGVPTLVEVKRSADTRIRREVVGQLLDYAANASYWTLEGTRAAFEARHEDPEDAERAISDFLHHDGDADPDAVDEFWKRVGANLRAARFRLLFVADEIPSELRRVIEYLNGQMTETEVLGLEVRQFVERDGARQTLVPRLIGQTESARAKKGGSGAAYKAWATRRRNRGEADVIAAVRKAQPDDVADRVIALYMFMRDAGAEASWGGGQDPSVTMWLGKSSDSAQHNPVAVGFFPKGVSVSFTDLRGRHRSLPEMERLVKLVREIPGTAPYLEGIEEKNYGMHTPMPPDEVLASDDALEAFKRAVSEASKPAD